MKVDGEVAFVLHTRPYRETSQLVDMFSRHYGRLRVVARGSRGGRTRPGRSQISLQPFTPLQLDWSGKGELKTLIRAEPIASFPLLEGERLYSGFYLNELLLRLLAEHDPHEQLFDQYRKTLLHLAETDSLEKMLRNFEMILLDEVGYGLVMDADAESGEPIRAGAWYRYDQQYGFVEQARPRELRSLSNWFSGETLLALRDGHYEVESVLKDAKRLIRLALEPHLGGKPLRSRELFRTTEQKN